MSLVANLIFLLPASRLKNLMLRWFGHEIDPTASVGPTLVVGRTTFHLGRHARINFGNVFHDVKSVLLADHAGIGQWNWISSVPAVWDEDLSFGRLKLGEHAVIVSRHIFDCSGGIAIGAYTTVAGYRSVFLTHQIDVQVSRQTYGPIEIGEYCLVGSCNHFVKGAVLPDRTVTAMGALVRPGLTRSEVLYGGVPAKVLAQMEGAAYFTRVQGPVAP